MHLLDFLTVVTIYLVTCRWTIFGALLQHQSIFPYMYHSFEKAAHLLLVCKYPNLISIARICQLVAAFSRLCNIRRISGLCSCFSVSSHLHLSVRLCIRVSYRCGGLDSSQLTYSSPSNHHHRVGFDVIAAFDWSPCQLLLLSLVLWRCHGIFGSPFRCGQQQQCPHAFSPRRLVARGLWRWGFVGRCCYW